MNEIVETPASGRGAGADVLNMIGLNMIGLNVAGVHVTGLNVIEVAGGTDASAEQEWQERALCAQTDPEAFFPEKGGSTREAKRICAGCEVKAECLEYALTQDERFGIWGGLSERERRRLRRTVS